MFLCNQTATLINVRFDKTADCSAYVATVLKGVSWFSTTKSSVDSKGLNSANTATIRIPVDVDCGGKQYIDPQGYTEAEDVSRLFTLNEGDFLVPGDIHTQTLTPATIRKIHGAVTILGVTDNRRAQHAQHWKVDGA